jgi:hypothetical protein
MGVSNLPWARHIASTDRGTLACLTKDVGVLPGVMAPAWNPSPWEVQAGEDLEFEADFARCLLGEKKKKKLGF